MNWTSKNDTTFATIKARILKSGLVKFSCILKVMMYRKLLNVITENKEMKPESKQYIFICPTSLPSYT
jgi:hypothetical protein